MIACLDDKSLLRKITSNAPKPSQCTQDCVLILSRADGELNNIKIDVSYECSNNKAKANKTFEMNRRGWLMRRCRLPLRM